MKYGVLSISLVCLSIVLFSATDVLAKKMYVSAKSGLVLRKGPDRKEKKIATLPYGTPVEVLEYSKKKDKIGSHNAYWAKIKTHNNAGWVYGAFLKADLVRYMTGILTDRHDEGDWAIFWIKTKNNKRVKFIYASDDISSKLSKYMSKNIRIKWNERELEEAGSGELFMSKFADSIELLK